MYLLVFEPVSPRYAQNKSRPFIPVLNVWCFPPPEQSGQYICIPKWLEFYTERDRFFVHSYKSMSLQQLWLIGDPPTKQNLGAPWRLITAGVFPLAKRFVTMNSNYRRKRLGQL